MARHTDSAAEESEHFPQDRQNEFSSFNPESTTDVSLEDPDTEEIRFKKPLLVALANENKYEPDCQEIFYDECLDGVFDQALCDLAEMALDIVGLTENTVPLRFLRALMIKRARGIDHYSALEDYISSTYSDEEVQQLGLRQIYEKSSYRKAAKSLKTSDDLKQLHEATDWAVHAVFWNGVPLPKSVREYYDLEYSLGPEAEDFTRATRDYSKYRLISEVVDIIEDDLNFNTTPKKSLRSIIGILSYSAQRNVSHEDYEEGAHHIFGLSNSYAGSSIHSLIGNLELYEVEEMFHKINVDLLQYVLEKNVVSEPVIVSADLTDIQSIGQSEINEQFLTEDGRWRIFSLGITDPSLEFAFGVRLVKSESQRDQFTRKLLRDLTSITDVSIFLADRGFDGVDDIDSVRDQLNDKYLIHAQDRSGTTLDTSDYEKARARLESQQTTVIEDAGYQDLTPPVQLIVYQSGGESDSIRGFLTGVHLPRDHDLRREKIQNLNFVYNNRAKIETAFRMGKNFFRMGADSPNPVHKSFYVHMSLLLYNIYQILNTVPSPESGIELDVSQQETLQLLQVIGFEGVSAADSFQYYQQDT